MRTARNKKRCPTSETFDRAVGKFLGRQRCLGPSLGHMSRRAHRTRPMSKCTLCAKARTGTKVNDSLILSEAPPVQSVRCKERLAFLEAGSDYFSNIHRPITQP